MPPLLRSLPLAAALALAPLTATRAAPPAPAADAAAQAELRQARQQLRELTRKIAELSLRLGGREAPRAYAFSYLSDRERGMIGIVLENDGNGIKLAAVSPGGPAEKAGLRAGDRLRSINGKSVQEALQATDGDEDPVARVTHRLIGPLKVGQTVDLELERGGKAQKVQVTAERRENWDWPMLALAATPEAGEEDIEVYVDGADEAMRHARKIVREVRRMHVPPEGAHKIRRIVIDRNGGLDLRLANLNAGLQPYFGTDSGVLVLDKGQDTLNGLQTGDVILSIAGERVETPREVMRAFAQRKNAVGVNVEIMRQRKRQIVSMDVPEQLFHWEHAHPLAPLPPLPPTPPAVPQAPKAPATPR